MVAIHLQTLQVDEPRQLRGQFASEEVASQVEVLGGTKQTQLARQPASQPIVVEPQLAQLRQAAHFGGKRTSQVVAIHLEALQ